MLLLLLLLVQCECAIVREWINNRRLTLERYLLWFWLELVVAESFKVWSSEVPVIALNVISDTILHTLLIGCHTLQMLIESLLHGWLLNFHDIDRLPVNWLSLH